MKNKEFIRRLDHPAIEAAIKQAELLTSGEIRVAVTYAAAPEPVVAARKVFVRLGMVRTARRNSVLIYVAPASQTFAVIGDQGVHQKCGEAFWQELSVAMSGYFKREEYTAGLLHGITRAGELLAAHFPHETNDTNELSDKVVQE